MITVKVEFFSYIKFESGLDQILVNLKDQSTISDLFAAMGKSHGNDLMKHILNTDEKTPIALVLLDQNRCDADTLLNDGDIVRIMPFLSGG